MTRTSGVLLLCASAFISFLLSISSEIDGGMGGLVNIFSPIFAGVLAIIFFLIFFGVSEKRNWRVWLLIILCTYNIYVGMALRLDNDNWPLIPH